MWQESALRGIRSRLAQIAVHPTEANRVALATEEGLFLSSDYGDTFELIDETGPAIAAEFDPSGVLLFLATVTCPPTTWRIKRSWTC